MTTLDEMMGQIRRRLAVAQVDDPMTEARILAGGLLGFSRSDFITRGQIPVAQGDIERIEAAVERRIQGEPPYRILGQRAFHGLELKLSPDTLEPRPDTETLVDLVLGLLADRKSEPLDILDLGIGTGAICLALLSNLPLARGLGTDLAQGALDTAMENAKLHGLSDRFTTVRSDWLTNVSGRFDVIVSNPPYIRSGAIPVLDREVREHDPLLALDGGADGLDAYRAIAAAAPRALKPGGIIALETGYDQKDAVCAIFTAAGFDRIAAVADLAGNDRAQAFRIRS